MKRWSQFAMAAVASVALVACGQNGRDQAEQQPAAGSPQTAVGTAGANAVDRNFVDEMAADSREEVELGRLAQERASNPQVREFAGMMVRDHQKSGEELMQVAQRNNVQVSTDHREHEELRQRLQDLKGAEFDREYIRGMVEAHERAVNQVQEKAEDGDNAELQQWASRTLPVLRQHLERARQIEQSLDGNRAGNRDR